MAVKKLGYIKDIKYKGVHPLDKKKLIKKINNYIDNYNKSSASVFETLEVKKYSEIFSNFINKEITYKLDKEIAKYTLKSPKNSLEDIEKNALEAFPKSSQQLEILRDVIGILNKESLFNGSNLLFAMKYSIEMFEKILKSKKSLVHIAV